MDTKGQQTISSLNAPLEYLDADQILKTEVSGNFPGSPIVLAYHLEIKNGLIQSLKITG